MTLFILDTDSVIKQQKKKKEGKIIHSDEMKRERSPSQDIMQGAK